MSYQVRINRAALSGRHNDGRSGGCGGDRRRGGLCAAARLFHAGLYTIVVDDKDRIGGRASTEEIDGFKVNIGAIAIELGGVFEETLNTVGAALDIRIPEPASSFFIDGKLI